MKDAMNQISIVRSLPEEKWRQFVDCHPHGNIFHTPEMFEVFTQARNHEPELWAAVRGETILALLLPVRIHTVPLVPHMLAARAIAYGGVLYAQDQDGQDGLTKLLQTYRHATKHKALFIELRNQNDLGNIQHILGDCNYVFEDHLNFLIDTNLPMAQVMNNINKSTQKKIARALSKQQFDIVEVQEIAQVETCYNILKQTYANAHIPLVDISMFEAAFKILYPKGHIKFLLGRAEGQDIAASVVLLYKDVVYGWYRGFNRAFASYLPNDLMVWDILKWGAGNNFNTFDFGGAGRPDEKYGPREFKAKFGGKLVNYGRNTYVYSTNLLRISKWGYDILRHLR
jgi:serine/alanine adding enzyme